LKELRSRYPSANIAIIDYDPGSAEVNQLNRIKLLMAVAQRNQAKGSAPALKVTDCGVQ
jgi:predicted nucleotide-binding protein (sugar kinase/HSP70/actin superfamily)